MGTYILPTSLYRSLLHLLEELYLLEVLCFLGVRVRSLRARVTLGPNIHAHAEKEKRALPDFIRWGPGYESVYFMGFTTQGPYIQKEHTKLYKILKFRVNWANIEQDASKFAKKCKAWIAGLAIHTFVSKF